MTDLLIKNAKIIDGTGAPSFIGNIAIENDVIKAVTPIEQARPRLNILSMRKGTW